MSVERSQATQRAIAQWVRGLKETQGCLGVEVAHTTSNKHVIFAWFENKEAVLRWYHSSSHQHMQRAFFPAYTPRTPLQHVSAESGPIMAIASLTLADQSALSGTAMPITQIAIELYQPLAGGLFLGGRFAPTHLKVQGMRDYTPPAK